MKKLFLLLCLVILLSLGGVVAGWSTYERCESYQDIDYGFNPYTFETFVTGTIGNEQMEWCSNWKEVVEYACEVESTTKNKNYICPFGCDTGLNQCVSYLDDEAGFRYTFLNPDENCVGEETSGGRSDRPDAICCQTQEGVQLGIGSLATSGKITAAWYEDGNDMWLPGPGPDNFNAPNVENYGEGTAGGVYSNRGLVRDYCRAAGTQVREYSCASNGKDLEYDDTFCALGCASATQSGATIHANYCKQCNTNADCGDGAFCNDYWQCEEEFVAPECPAPYCVGDVSYQEIHIDGGCFPVDEDCPYGCDSATGLCASLNCDELNTCSDANTLERFLPDAEGDQCVGSSYICPLGCQEGFDGASCVDQTEEADSTYDMYTKNHYTLFDEFNNVKTMNDICYNSDTQVKQFGLIPAAGTQPFRLSPFLTAKGGSAPSTACSEDTSQLIVVDAQGVKTWIDCPLGCSQGVFGLQANCIGGNYRVDDCTYGCSNGACIHENDLACVDDAGCDDGVHTNFACTNHQCDYACSDNVDCGSDEVCLDGMCALACTSNLDCIASDMFCSAQGVCLQQECASHEVCAATDADMPYCDFATYSCVACTDDAQCDGQCENNVCLAWDDPEGDNDGDVLINEEDNCDMLANPDQVDTDEDGVGDGCDLCANSDETLVADANGCTYGQTPDDTTGGSDAPSCLELGGINCGSNSCATGDAQTTLDAAVCCVGADATCSYAAWSSASNAVVTYTYGACQDPDGDGVGTLSITSSDPDEPPFSEPCTVLVDATVPFSSYTGILGLLVVLLLFYAIRRKL